MKIEIIRINGKWMVNGKPYDQVSDEEKQFFDQFLLFMKRENGKELHDVKLKKSS